MQKKILLAKKYGPCMGVSRAIRLACITAKKYPGKTFLLGEIVHNQHVVEELKTKFKIKTVHHLNDIPQKAAVIIRAHGITPTLRKKLEEKNLNIIDATCPLVTRVHQVVKNYIEQNWQLVYLASDPKHDEAVGVYGEAPAKIKLVTVQEIGKIKIINPSKTVVLTQTTLSILETQQALNKLKKRYPTIKIEPHICPATTERQQAVIVLAKLADLIVVVGSPTSSNSKRLAETAKLAGKKRKIKVYLVDQEKELKKTWFDKARIIGVTSGASTPDNILHKVIKKIKTF